MKIHEYQAKEILRQYQVAVPEGRVAFSPEEAESVAGEIDTGTLVVKAQIHAGGRGKGGGVKIVHSPEEVREVAGEMIGMNLVTHQTGPEGKEVNQVLVEEGMEIERELYAGLVLDRSKNRVVFMVSSEGGVEIEKVAAESPEKILKEWIDPAVGFRPFQATRLAYGLGLSGDQAKSAVKFFLALYKTYDETDASLAEINPLVVTSGGDVLALDAKINFDDNALYRHKEIEELRDFSEEAPSEVEASEHGLNYIKLDGNVGCMVNGAGLAMATMDIIKLSGGEPANFLDVGGAASSDTVKQGFKIIMQDQSVQAVLINIFGGIVRCDRVAQGIIDALSDLDLDVPVVVRLEGTNAKEAAVLLEDSPLEFTVAGSLKEAAEKSVAVAA